MTILSNSWLTAAAALAMAVAALAAYRRARGTTLAAPAAWAVVAALVLAACEAYLAGAAMPADTLAASLLRYVAAVGTVCTPVAVLGAKRPQDRGWMWVVLSLWIVLLAPAGQAAVAPAGSRLELFAAWRLMLGGLVALGLMNYLPTMLFSSAILFALGQAGLLSDYLFDDAELATAGQRTVSLLAIAAAIFLARRRFRATGRAAASSEAELGRLQERWRGFRDGWGAFWGLRVLQRINHTAQLRRWPVRLHWWDGFAPIEAEIDLEDFAAGSPQLLAELWQTTDALLWRFERPRSAPCSSAAGEGQAAGAAPPVTPRQES